MPSKVLEMTTEEKNEMKMIENIEKDIENTGRWWELWESEEAKEYFAQIGCSEVIEIAIPELKKTFTAEDYTKMVNKKREAIETEQFKSSAYDTARYLELMDYDHPLISPLLFHVPTEFDKKIAKHPIPINFFNVTPVRLGFAIKELGGFEKLSENAIGDLKSAKNFQDRFYEIVVEAFFKMFYKDSTITFPEENLLNKGSKKPDMSIDDMMYVEIKNLNMSDYEKRIHKIIEKEITDTIRKRTKDFKGSVGYNISFDQVGFDPKEIMKAAETTKKLIESVEVKPGKVIVKKEGGVSIELNFTPDNDRQLSGSIIGLGQSERNDIFRIYRILTSSKKSVRKKSRRSTYDSCDTTINSNGWN